jgi:hypothetical protein
VVKSPPRPVTALASKVAIDEHAVARGVRRLLRLWDAGVGPDVAFDSYVNILLLRGVYSLFGD